MKTFGDGYTYEDLVKTCSFYAIEGIGSLNRGIDDFVLNQYQVEFVTDLDYKEILSLFNKDLEELKRDVVKYYIHEKRKERKINKTDFNHKALLFAEKHGIVEYEVEDNKMVFREKFILENAIYEAKIDLNTMIETREQISNIY